MIMAVDENSIIHYKLINETINNNIFKDFLEEMILKVGKDNIKNYILIMDNAKSHISKKIKKYSINNKLKILTKIPYYSIFNGIEYVFFFIITKLYKFIIKNRKELKQKIECILKDKQIEQSIKKVYLSELKIYLDLIK